MKAFLIVSAVIETGASLVILALPSSAVRLLVGSSSRSPSELTMTRIAAVALLALAVACWRARDETHAGRAAVAAMLVYDVGAVVVLTWATVAFDVPWIGISPAIVLHSVMTAWAAMALRRSSAAAPRPTSSAARDDAPAADTQKAWTRTR